MQSPLLTELLRRRSAIRSRWDILLRTEPVTSPLAHPDSLVHLIDSTLDEIFSVLISSKRPPARAAVHPVSSCACGRNPLLAYFAAGRQAVREGLVLSQAALAPFDPAQRDSSLCELEDVLDDISGREIEAFCGVCQFRSPIAGLSAALTAP